jgi:hypothetical protein
MKSLTENEMMNAATLADIQAAVKAPKAKYNTFGKYYYRSAEDIMEAVKPVINPLGYWLTVSDSIEKIGDRYYIKCLATLTNGNNVYQVTAFAREDESRKGMDPGMLTGATSSYARKYALQGLFSLDQNKDVDDLHGVKQDDAEPNFEWKQELSNCKSLIDLMTLYKSNKEVVEANNALKKMFSERKSELK